MIFHCKTSWVLCRVVFDRSGYSRFLFVGRVAIGRTFCKFGPFACCKTIAGRKTVTCCRTIVCCKTRFLMIVTRQMVGSQSENASEKGDWLRAGLVLESLENIASRCLSPFSRAITNSVSPSQKWDWHQGCNLCWNRWKVSRHGACPLSRGPSPTRSARRKSGTGTKAAICVGIAGKCRVTVPVPFLADHHQLG